MPYISLITFLVFISSLILPLVSFAAAEYSYLVIIFTFLVWVLSLSKSFVISLIAVILTAYFSQRMLFLHVAPEVFTYKWVTNSQINESLVFSISAVSAMVLGSLMFQLIYQGVKRPYITSGYEKIFGINITINQFVKYASYLVIIGFAVKIYTVLIIGFVVGSEAYVVTHKSLFEVVLFRGIQTLTSLLIFLLLVFARPDLFERKTKVIAILSIVISLMFNIFVDASKGALLTVIIFYLIVLNYSRGAVSKKVILYAIAVFIFSLLLFSFFMIWYRTVVIAFVSTGEMSAEFFKFDLAKAIISFSGRVAGFDWLTGIMAYSGTEFNYPSSIYHQLVQTVNYYVPGDIFNIPEHVPIAHGMGIYLNEKPAWELTRYLPGGLAMSYLVFGWWSFLYYFGSAFILRYIEKYGKHLFIKLAIVYYFGVHHLISGTGLFELFSNIVVALIMVVVLIKLIIFFKSTSKKMLIKT
jgi:hypothetical protein